MQLSVVLLRLRQWTLISAPTRRALWVEPLSATGWHNLAASAFACSRPADGLRSLHRALAVLPDFAHALLLAGNYAVETGRLADARRRFRRAAAALAGYAEADLNLALIDLLEGDNLRGWQRFQQRWRCDNHRGFRWAEGARRWDGSAAPGKRLILRAEPQQALGDTIQFVRFIPEAAARVGAVVLECAPSLHRLLAPLPGLAGIVGLGAESEPADVTAGLMDLPALFAADPARWRSPRCYLRAEAAEVAAWRALLADLASPRIGVCWRGNPAFALDRLRSPGLEAFMPVIERARGHCVSLVYERAAGERLPDHVADPMALIGDMADTAALIAAIDLVITSDTAVAHLAGALGKLTWLLLHEPPDWRWLIGRSDSPWYPSIRLFRQQRPRDWTKPIDAVVEALAEPLAAVAPP
jgi:hypothetical protein